MPLSIGPQNADTLPGKNDSFEKSQAAPANAGADKKGKKNQRGLPDLPKSRLPTDPEASATHEGLLQASDDQGIAKPPSGN